ncbi:MAG: O-antigen ligase family protein, partial [Lentisphaerae bacterium]|nr:O-antigen ligase family protein [Lentisphaerota bacterium]
MSRPSPRSSHPGRQADGAGGVSAARRCLRWYLCILAVLGPLKFGSIIGPSEIALFPADLLEWVFGSWPAFLLGPLAGLGLGAALWLCPGSLGRHPARLALAAWGALLVSCLPGLLRTGEWDIAVTFVLYLAGVCAYLAAVLLVTGVDPGFRRALLAAIVTGTLLSGLAGWHQRLWGFEAMRRYAEAQMRETGQPWSAAMQGKLEQRRVYRPFFHPNSYAAHLVLTGPLALLALWRAGRRVEPRRLSQPLFVALGVVVVGGALLLSGSRAAQLAVGAGLGLAILGCRGLRRWRWPLLLGAILLGGALMAAVNAGRDLLSASARFDYYRAALVMFLERPLTGVGLGEFLSAYLQIKPAGAEETRAAHNLILEMLSQAGLWGGLAALGCVLVPFWLSLSRPPAGAAEGSSDEGLRLAGVAGLGAWVAHAMLDFNLQIPPTVMLAAVVPVLCRPLPAAVLPPGRSERLLLVFLAVLATAGFWRVPGEWRFRRLSDDADRQSLAALREST